MYKEYFEGNKKIPCALHIVFWFQVIGSGHRDAQLLMLLTLTEALAGLGYRFTVSFFSTLQLSTFVYCVSILAEYPT